MKAAARFAALALAIYGAPALADVSAQVAGCRTETDSLKRLVCYDAIPVDAGAAKTATAGIIATYEAGGTTTTRPFTASGPFVVRVEETDAAAVFEIRHADGGQFSGTMLTAEPGQIPAEAYIAKPGKYVLDVMAFGYWRAEVIRAD